MGELVPEVRDAILDLLRKGVASPEIARQTGEPTGRIAAIKANLTRGTYDKTDNNEILNELEAITEATITEATITEATFGLERDLQSALRKSIDQLEPGLTIADGNKEKTVPSGRIDIMARDQSGAIVVVELKARRADRDAIGQLLSYMGDVMESENTVRGIIVAEEFTPQAKAAARAARSIRLVEYGFKFSFRTVFPPLPGSE